VVGGKLRTVLYFGVALAWLSSCGETTPRGEGGSEPTAGDDGVENAGAPNEPGGAPSTPTDTGGRGGAGGEAGDAAEGGTPDATGGRPPTGGNASGGAGGAVGIQVPEGCESTTPIVAERHCSLELSCDSRRMSVACTDDRGLWTCSCSGAETSVTYEIPDLPSAATCELAARVCAEPEVLRGEETCQRTETPVPGLCELEDACQTWHELDGRRVRTRRDWKAACEPCPGGTETGGLAMTCCRCSVGELAPARDPADYRLADYDPSTGCAFLAQLCEVDSFEPAGDAECAHAELSANIDFGCQIVTHCVQPIELADGAELTLANEFRSSCMASGSGPATACNCSDADGRLGYEVFWDLPEDDIDTCRAVDAACTGVEPPELGGEVECVPSFDTLTRDSCALRSVCDQPATLGGVDAVVRTRSSVRCEREEPGSESWICHCTSTQAPALELEGGDAEQTCLEAVGTCAELTPGT